MKYIISTLGCKVNQYETQAMETMLLEHGHEPAAPGEIADAVIVNTCAVTAESGRKSRQTIRRLRDENPGAVIAVCGCYSQLDPDAVAKTGADVIFGSNDHAGMVAALENALGTGEHSTSIDEPFKRRVFEQLPAGAVAGRTRAMLKIQDGCVNFCTYCIIPYTRGRLRSLPLDAAAAETARIDADGYREIVLTGIEVASYGVDLPGKPGLADVIETVASAAPDMRIRLGSLEPTVITEDFCRRLAATGRLCRHFHLSLQSGCDRTLKAMNRKYDTAGFYRAVEHGAVLPVRHAAACVFRPSRRDHRPDLRLPRRDGGGSRRDAGVHPEVRLRGHAHFPLLPPPRHARGQDARPVRERGEVPPRARGAEGRRRDAPRFHARQHRADSTRAV